VGAAAAATVLIVEDDASIRLLCRVNLELEGIRVREADRVDRAREEIESEPPAVVFLDVHLGGGSSESLLDELVEARIPVVLMSGSADVDDYRERATEIMCKPFEPAAFVETARRYVG
jgi:two-component system, response regulator AauR